MSMGTRQVTIREGQFQNLRFCFQPSAGYIFTKTFDDFEAAEQFLIKLSPDKKAGDIIEIPYDGSDYFSHKKILSELLALIPGEIDEKAAFKRVMVKKDQFSNENECDDIRLQIKLITDPVLIPTKDSYYSHEATMERLKQTNPLEAVNKQTHFEFHYKWVAQVEVRIVYTVIRNEVKVPGQPYHPGGEEEMSTAWFPLYTLSDSDKKDSYTHTTDSINPNAECLDDNKWKKVKKVELASWCVKGDKINTRVTGE